MHESPSGKVRRRRRWPAKPAAELRRPPPRRARGHAGRLVAGPRHVLGVAAAVDARAAAASSSSTRFESAARKRRSWETKSIVPSKSRSARDEHLLGGEVEVVGRLVEHQEVRRVVEHARQHERAPSRRPRACGRSSRRRRRRSRRRRRACAASRSTASGKAPSSVSTTVLVGVEQLHRVLGEVAELDAGAERDRAGVGRGLRRR